MTVEPLEARCLSRLVLVGLTIAMAAVALAEGPVIPIKDAQGDLVFGGTIKLSGESGFFVVSDADSDGRVSLVDLDGKPIPPGKYSAQIEDSAQQIVRDDYMLEIRDDRVFEIAADGQRVPTGVIVGGVAAGALLLGSGGGGGGGPVTEPPPVSEPPPVPEPTGPLVLEGVVGCVVMDDPSELANLVGLVGGDTRVELDTVLAAMDIPVGGDVTMLTGSRSNANISVTGFGVVAGVSGVASTFVGTVDDSGGSLNGRLDVNTNGALVEQSELTNPAVTYSCAGTLQVLP